MIERLEIKWKCQRSYLGPKSNLCRLLKTFGTFSISYLPLDFFLAYKICSEDLVLAEERTSKKDRQRIMEGEIPELRTLRHIL